MNRAGLAATLLLSGYLLNACGGGFSTPQLVITSGTPPTGLVGTGYDGSRESCFRGTCEISGGFPLLASGGVAPYAWTWAAATGSSLPKGLTVCPGGFICGIPATVGSYNVVVVVSDSGSPPAQRSANYAIVIAYPPPVISISPAPPDGAVNVPYAGFTFKATGGAPPLTWSETGALPPGMAVGTDGSISGTPTTTGSFPIVVMVQDSTLQNANPQDFTIQIDAQLPSFKTAGNLQTARAWHTATLLNNGKVIVIGGLGDNGTAALASAEVFDPASGQFTPTGNLLTARLLHTATLLKSGMVLVTGGEDVNGNAIADAELFDPSSGSFTFAGTMNNSRTGHTATLLNDGRVLIAGGIDSNKALLSTAELFDPTTGQFTLANGPLTARRAHHAATLLSTGKVVLAGGSPDTSLGDIFDPASNTFTSTTTGGYLPSLLTATLLVDDRVLLAGGEDTISFNCNVEGPSSIAGAALFDPTTTSFSDTASMTSSRAQHTATLLPDGRVLVAGGSTIRTAQSGCALSTQSTALASAELFEPTPGTFALTSTMTTARSNHTATLLVNGDVLVIGGVDANNKLLASAELYR